MVLCHTGYYQETSKFSVTSSYEAAGLPHCHQGAPEALLFFDKTAIHHRRKLIWPRPNSLAGCFTDQDLSSNTV